MEKKHKLIYWILTILMFVPGVIGGVIPPEKSARQK